jgi:hypothetical protein
MLISLKKTLGTSAAEPLSATSIKCSQIIVQPFRGNAALVTLGDSTVVATSGLEIVKPVTSAQSVPIVITSFPMGNNIDLSKIYVIGTANDGVNVLYEQY